MPIFLRQHQPRGLQRIMLSSSPARFRYLTRRCAHSSPSKKPENDSIHHATNEQPHQHSPQTTRQDQSTESPKSIAQADEELHKKLDEMSSDGGVSALELEDGKPVTMKRSVKNNLFRYI
ncbi:hypothetical protein FQN50_000973 [Emmonsiellopsis sp. PD_5]|nr:hypothetical protein FQN50_000973 [Emmonsiellopsis sp. PD_5]